MDDELPLFADRPDWADIEPLEQYDAGNTLAPILYTVEYNDASNYFRAIVKKGEKTERVLELSERMIRLNPAHYTAWQYRYETLLHLLSPSLSSTKKSVLTSHPLIAKELALLDDLATRFLKTYQVWHHRRLIVSLTGAWRREMRFVEQVLIGPEGDAKNYHTWSYRQWILGHFGTDANAQSGAGEEEAEEGDDVWAGEQAFIDLVLSKDVRNNSAWHHRFFVVWESGVRRAEEDRGEALLSRELAYVKHKISLAPNNSSAWNYLRGVLRTTGTPFSALLTFVQPYTRPHPTVVSTEDTIIDLDNPLPGESAQLPCVEALEFLADVYEAQAGGAVGETTDATHASESAISIWKSLAEEHDTIRKNYWQYRIGKVVGSKAQSNSGSG